MLRRIRPGRVIGLARRELPGPLDVVNLITTEERFEPYKWYGLLVMPVMTAVGGRVCWMGRHVRALHGDRQADKLLLVRYPSQRHFLAMTLNPYYLLINRLREAGVRRFEASFTHASHTDPELARRRVLVGVHFSARDALPAITSLMKPVGELVYATSTVASLGILDPPRPTDPHPLRLTELALFACDEDPNGGAPIDALAAVTDGLSVQLYRREPRSAYRPSFS